MADFTDKLSIIRQFINILSWKKLLQLVVFFMILGSAMTIVENRDIIYKLIFKSRFSDSPPADYKLSRDSIDEIDSAVTQSTLIVGMQITVVDFNRNVRLIVYSSIDDEKLKLAYQTYIQRSIGEVPLFNSDSANNVRISQLINGEFVCMPYKDTIAYKFLPEGAESVTTICANGIPPYYGKFTGIVTLYLKRPPTASELDQLKTLSKSISLSVFERDFK